MVVLVVAIGIVCLLAAFAGSVATWQVYRRESMSQSTRLELILVGGMVGFAGFGVLAAARDVPLLLLVGLALAVGGPGTALLVLDRRKASEEDEGRGL